MTIIGSRIQKALSVLSTRCIQMIIVEIYIWDEARYITKI